MGSRGGSPRRAPGSSGSLRSPRVATASSSGSLGSPWVAWRPPWGPQLCHAGSIQAAVAVPHMHVQVPWQRASRSWAEARCLHAADSGARHESRSGQMCGGRGACLDLCTPLSFCSVLQSCSPPGTEASAASGRRAASRVNDDRREFLGALEARSVAHPTPTLVGEWPQPITTLSGSLQRT